MVRLYLQFISCTLAVLVCVLAVSPPANSNAMGDADRKLFEYIYEDSQNKFFDEIMPTLGRMGDSRNYGLVFMLLAAFGNEKMAETAKLAAAAFAVGAPVGHAVRRITNRARPLTQEDKNSFPSGHVVLSTNIAVIVGYEYPVLRIPLYVLAAGSAYSRIYLGRHFPGDVAAGVAIGALTSIFIIRYKRPVLGFTF